MRNVPCVEKIASSPRQGRYLIKPRGRGPSQRSKAAVGFLSVSYPPQRPSKGPAKGRAECIEFGGALLYVRLKSKCLILTS